MHFFDLQEFIEHQEKTGNLQRITAPVDPYLEIAAIVNKACKGKIANKALLFEKVKGSKLPLAANIFGSMSRTAAALGVERVDSLAEKLKRDLAGCQELESGQALADLVRKTITANQPAVTCSLAKVPCRHGLHDLPLLHSWPKDGGRYITLGQVITRDPVSKVQNYGMYRVQVIGQESALIRFHPGSGGGKHLQAWHDQGSAMPVTVVLGGPPALTWCAGLSLPEGVTETDFISYLTGHSIPLANCGHSDLLAPATAEIVIEGQVLPGELGSEGPFGNHTGYYSEATPAPVMQVESVCRREAAIYPCTVVGPPPMENTYLAQANERILLALLQHDLPWVVDIHMPPEGIYHRAAFVAIDDPGETVTEINRKLRQSRLLSRSRLIILLDKECPLHNYRDVYWRFINAECWEQNGLCAGPTIDARRSTKKMRLIT